MSSKTPKTKTPKTPKTTPPPSPLESEEQEALAQALDQAGLLWSSTANGGRRDKRTAASLKRQGLKPGVPDLLIFSSTPQAPRGAAVELKRAPPNKGRLSPDQVVWLEELAREGWAALTCYGAADAVAQLREAGYNIPTPPPVEAKAQARARERAQARTRATSQDTPRPRSPRDDTPPPSRHAAKALPRKR